MEWSGAEWSGVEWSGLPRGVHITITIAKGRNGPQQGPPREHMPVQSTSELVFVITELARAEAMVAAGAVRQAAA